MPCTVSQAILSPDLWPFGVSLFIWFDPSLMSVVSLFLFFNVGFDSFT